MNPDSTLKVLGGIFSAVFCLLGGIAALLVVSHQNFAASAGRADGVVIEDYGRPHVRFQAGARTIDFYGSVRSSPPSFRAGEKVSVLYPKDNPDAAQIDSFWQNYLASVILGGIGSVFGAIGGIMLVAMLRSARRRARALELGVRVQAKVTGVSFNTSVRVNGRCPWVLEATFQEPHGKNYLFTSESIWMDPSPFYPVGSEVTVCYLEDDPSVNAFVLDKLPERV